ncbi:hypothetical protein B0H16DRAFT_1602303 [Mycena metata]|uniref:F-box domain-containing protein n=1 Tax=Mycena metata TaxID=1033252 RepID=A0AAD7HJF1_9AGAR|nr:hypothetical protein B0H16DRAFT_1602303 [Mycena metata]
MHVLLRIFTHLDAASVLRSAQVNSVCNRLAYSKHVWLAIVLDLGSRHLLARDTLLSLSSTHLINEVKRLVFGPRTWAANSSSPPTVQRSVRLSAPSSGRSFSEATLLSGDKHLLIKWGSGYEIWDIAHSRRIWARDDVLASQIGVQVVRDGTEILIIICTGQEPIWTTNLAQLDCKLVVSVSLLDLRTNSEKQLPHLHLPRTCPAFSDPVIADDIWAANVKWVVEGSRGCRGVLLVNWRKATFVLLHHPIQLVHKKLLRGHLLALTKANALSALVSYSPPSFNSHWQSLDSTVLAAAAQAAIPINPIAILQRVEYPLMPLRTPLLSVHECPLNRGSYLVSTHVAGIRSEEFQGHLPHAALLRYRLTLSESESAPPTWERVSSAGTLNSVLVDAFTYAGYGMSFPAHVRESTPRVVCRQECAGEDTSAVPLPAEIQTATTGCVSLSPDTGALIVCSPRSVDVHYYE